MRRRVRALVNERTQMLVAISHDLRTPLTRLRLRAERVRDEPLRAAMLQDIGKVGEMLTETLAYIREGGQREQPSLTDLPSLLETIAAEFSDVGHKVSYRGPDRLAFAGRAQRDRAGGHQPRRERDEVRLRRSKSPCARSITGWLRSRSTTTVQAFRPRCSVGFSSRFSRATARDRLKGAAASVSGSPLRATSSRDTAALSNSSIGRPTA